MKSHQFHIGKSIYLIVIFIFVFGLFLEVTQTDFILKTYQYNTSTNAPSKVADPINIPDEVLKGIEQKQFLLLYDDNDSESVELKNNVKHTLSYMKQYVEEFTVDAIPEVLAPYQMVVVTFEDIDQIQDISILEQYVSDGGHCFFAIRPDLDDAFYKIYRKLGIYEVGTFQNVAGIELTSNILINENGLKIKDDFIQNSSLYVGLEEQTNLYAKGSSNKIPLLWDTDYVNGTFIIFNGTMLSAKSNRGLIAGAISLAIDDFMYPIMNMKLTYLDSFPGPIPEGYNDKIYEELKLDVPTYYRNVWWPFIQKESTKYDVKLTGSVLQSYNDGLSSPFDNEYDAENLTKYGRELLKMGGEVAINGYNHHPFITKSENKDPFTWLSTGDMRESLELLENNITASFPNYRIQTYVPPANQISQKGIEVLSKTIPTITNISSMYLPNGDPLSLIQEFDKQGHFYYLPRLTSGYLYLDRNKWIIANGITSIGVSSHSFQADEMLNPAVQTSWEELSKGLTFLFKDTYQKHPWLRSMTASEGAITLGGYQQVDILIENHSNKKVGYIDGFTSPISFILRTDKKMGVTKGCNVELIDEDTYLIMARKEIFEVELR